MVRFVILSAIIVLCSMSGFAAPFSNDDIEDDYTYSDESGKGNIIEDVNDQISHTLDKILDSESSVLDDDRKKRQTSFDDNPSDDSPDDFVQPYDDGDENDEEDENQMERKKRSIFDEISSIGIRHAGPPVTESTDTSETDDDGYNDEDDEGDENEEEENDDENDEDEKRKKRETDSTKAVKIETRENPDESGRAIITRSERDVNEDYNENEKEEDDDGDDEDDGENDDEGDDDSGKEEGGSDDDDNADKEEDENADDTNAAEEEDEENDDEEVGGNNNNDSVERRKRQVDTDEFIDLDDGYDDEEDDTDEIAEADDESDNLNLDKDDNMSRLKRNAQKPTLAANNSKTTSNSSTSSANLTAVTPTPVTPNLLQALLERERANQFSPTQKKYNDKSNDQDDDDTDDDDEQEEDESDDEDEDEDDDDEEEEDEDEKENIDNNRELYGPNKVNEDDESEKEKKQELENQLRSLVNNIERQKRETGYNPIYNDVDDDLVPDDRLVETEVPPAPNNTPQIHTRIHLNEKSDFSIDEHSKTSPSAVVDVYPHKPEIETQISGNDVSMARTKHMGGEPVGPIATKTNLEEKYQTYFTKDPKRHIAWEEPKLMQNCWAQAMLATRFGFSPSCNAEGSFSPKQCFLERCWCVHKDGSAQDPNLNTRFVYSVAAIMLECTQNQ